ncbi:hypothetical protein [Streptomyces marianii]|uniref:Uncharacterized protein n=1 Tax=Streptomyces marianii TaxID=1817406 RepID=A0A5R9DRS1_9ACTN|nr:hypothetical protein [Streptomyces marianii]TLQ39297.1 hypothetical protein FEF34_38545 [Streptomyces marianii]
MDVSVYLDRIALKNAVLTLLVPPTEPEPRPRVEATGTEINSETDNPATLERAHRHAEELSALEGDLGGDVEDVQAELAELLGGDDGTVETADPEADRKTAHEIITALAAAYPLPPSVRDSLPLAP